MTFLYKGVVEDVLPVQTFSSGFTKRDIVIGDTSSKYPNLVRFSFKKDNIEKLSSIKKGERVLVRFVIDGRRWESPNGIQYFVDLTGLDVIHEGEPLEKKEAAPVEDAGNETVVVGQDVVADDIPF